MKYALIGLGAIGTVILAVLLIGLALPVRHRAGREATYPRPASDLFKAISTPSDFPSWRSGVTRVEMLPPSDGKTRFRETGKDGSITYEVERSLDQRELATRIADPSLPFGGTWTYSLIPKGDSTTLRIVEDGEVYNPIFRFVSRFVIGHTATIDRYLQDLGKKFGQNSVRTTD
jgi:hypothetical protein